MSQDEPWISWKAVLLFVVLAVAALAWRGGYLTEPCTKFETRTVDTAGRGRRSRGGPRSYKVCID